MTTKVNTSLTETWARDTWQNWEVYQPLTSDGQLGRNNNSLHDFGLSSQQHIDVRTFNEPSGWTGGLLTGYRSDVNNWPGGKAVFGGGGTNSYVSNYTVPIDLTTLGPDAQLTMALPNFAVGQIDVNNSFVDLSTDGFINNICSLSWASSSTPTGAGNCTLTWPYNALIGVDLTQITGVRIRIRATAACSVYMFALRLIGPNWIQTDVDFDNLDNQLRQCIPLNADTTTIPVANNQTLPPLWHTGTPPGNNDPHPINAEIGFLFNTGSQTQPNGFTLYMRELTKAFITQIDLLGQTQAQLQGQTQEALSLGISEKAPRTMADMDQMSMTDLDNQSMLNLESVNDPKFSSWISFTVNWGPISGLQITNSVVPDDGYQYSDVTFANNTTYLVVCDLTDNNASMTIFNVDQITLKILSPHYTTEVIPDPFMFPRRGGRIGFKARLTDGDSYVGAVRPRGVMFAEYRSSAMLSLTPVRGAQLYVQDAPDIELFTEWSALHDSADNYPQVVPDRQKFFSTHPDLVSTRVTITQPSVVIPSQGIISNVLTSLDDPLGGITNFDEIHLSFRVWVPSNAVSGSLDGSILDGAFLSSSGNIIPVVIPTITPNQWQEISIFRPVSAPYPISGLYQFILYYMGESSTTFWIDAVTVHQHAVRWDARSVIDDPWNSNEAPWTIFHDTTNSHTNGVRFTLQGNQLQLRAQGLRQDSVILSPPKLIPQYAELGRLVWPEDTVNGKPPVALITGSHVGRTYTFDGTTSFSPISDNSITNYLWSFGDGSFGTGPVVQHTYPAWVAGGTDYTVNLTVIDRSGMTNLVSTIVTL